MARRSTKKKSAAPLESAAPQKKKLPVRLLTAVGLTLLLGGIPFALGKYIEFSSPDPFDGGAYAYSANHLLTGARLWVDESSSAEPATLLCNVIGIKLFGYSDVGPEIIQMLLQLGGLAMMFYTVRRLFGNAPAVVSTTLAAILLSAPVIAKFGNVKEQFMIPFAVVAACAFALHETSGKKHWAVIAGAAAIIPYYFKPTGIAIVIAIGLYLAIKLMTHLRQWKTVFTTVALWLIGACLGLAFPSSLFLWQHALPRFLKTFPVILLEAIVLFSVLAFAVCAVLHYIPWKRIGSALKSVPRRLWLTGAALLMLSLLVAVASISLTKGANPKLDIPSYLQSLPFIRIPTLGIAFIYEQAHAVLKASGVLAESGYVAESRKVRSLADQAPQVLRYYHAVGAVTYSALAALLILAARWGWCLLKKQKSNSPLLAAAGLWALWWLIDMALVWVSPHSYEQYYLPLCVSGAMLCAYAVWLWTGWLSRRTNKLPPLLTAGAALLAILILITPVFAGFARSPDTAAEYKNRTGHPERRRGFAQALQTVWEDETAPWQAMSDYIRQHSTPKETLYVWGWFPGIYVQAQRMAPVPGAYEANMHVTPPARLARQISTLVSRLENNPPRYIVDSRKSHFPFDRPPLELWPIVPTNMFKNPQPRLLGSDPREIQAYEQVWARMLQQQFGEDEAERFAAMKPFRDFVMTRYRLTRQFGGHMLFERKD